MPDHLKKKGQQTWEDSKPRQRLKTKLESRSEARSLTNDALVGRGTALAWARLPLMTPAERATFFARQDTAYLEDNLYSDASMADPLVAQLIIDELHRRDE